MDAFFLIYISRFKMKIYKNLFTMTEQLHYNNINNAQMDEIVNIYLNSTEELLSVKGFALVKAENMGSI